MTFVQHSGLLLLVLTIGAPVCMAAKENTRPTQLPGYKAVPVRYGPLNKMVLTVSINGHPANLIVDTGANQTILDADAAQLSDVKPSQDRFTYMGMTSVNGQQLPLAFVSNLTAGNMSFGSRVVALMPSDTSDSFSPRLGNRRSIRLDGELGSDVLVGHKAVINCRSQYIFFKIDPSRASHLISSALAAKFARVPLRQEDDGAVSVPCSIHGHDGRLVVDTGGFITTFHEPAIRGLGIAIQSSVVSARFSPGVKRLIAIGQFDNLVIGSFRVPPAKFGVATLPNFVLTQGSTRCIGILGMDLLYRLHAIIDFDSMSLFLK